MTAIRNHQRPHVRLDRLHAFEHGLSERRVVEEIMLQPMPKRCFISVEEIAGSVEFLLGGAARNITGQCLVIDGGWTAQ